MPTQHPAEAARQTAHTALAALTPDAHTFLEALHAEHFPPAPGGPAYRLEDLLGHLVEAGRYGFRDERLALAVPVAYLRAMREAARLAAPQAKTEDGRTAEPSH
jgi:hypothetical protein